MMTRIIIVGPAASGKDFLKQRLGEKGFKLDVSYTTRSPREGEVNGKDYHFVSKKEFFDESMDFFEYVKFGEHYYGTGLWEWENCDVFIMEASAIESLSKKERKKSVVIYLNPPQKVRFDRLYQDGRGWDYVKITNRFETDEENFKNFTNYDIQITNPDF